MQDLKVLLIQEDLVWEDHVANRQKLEDQILHAEPGFDIIFLPEMFATGFSMNASNLAEKNGGESFKWMQRIASEKNSVVTGSLIIEAEGKYYNRLFWVYPGGEHEQYDKKHLFRLAGEHETYSAGKERLIIDYKGWKINPQICYDLRFPVWNRNQNDYDVIFFVANWPAKRRLAWQSLLRARAIENMAYVIGVNRVGLDGNDIYYAGDSGVVRYDGEWMWQAAHHSTTISVTLKKDALNQYKERFGFYLDADKFELR